MGSRALDWDRDRSDWPNAEASRFVTAAGLRWHVQVAGDGPALVLVHGTGASTHSWRDLVPSLARHFTVVAPDLPGHGFTEKPRKSQLSLPGMVAGIDALTRELGVTPALVVGHSAGAAILTRLCLDRVFEPHTLVSLNGALTPFNALAGVLFPPLAKALFLNPLAPRAFARYVDRARVRRLIDSNGSRLDERGVELYTRLLRSPDHVAAALGMMAQWDLRPLVADLARLPVPMLLAVGECDRAVLPEQAERVRSQVPRARIERLPGLGHLAHEEVPERVARLLVEAVEPASEAAVAGPPTAHGPDHRAGQP